MADLITVVVILVIIGAAVAYIIKEKKKGVRCIGCPAAGSCAAKNSGHSECSCSCHTGTKER